MERIERIETLIKQLESSADPGTRAGVRELVEAILEYHGAGLDRILGILRDSGPSGAAAIQAFARDALIGSLLLLYGLHPEDLETRVRRAVDGISNLELTGIADGVVRVRSGSVVDDAARAAIEQAIYSAAPETASVEIDAPQPAQAAFVPLEALLRA